MIDDHELFERASERFAPPERSFERLVDRRDRKHRNKRITAGVLALFVAAAGTGALVKAFPSGLVPADDDRRPSPAAVTTPSAHSEAEQIIAEGTLASFAATESGTVLTVWDTCESQFDTDCGHAWRLGTGSQTQATGMVGHGDVHVDVNPSEEGFVLTPAGSDDLGFLIAQDGTASPLSKDCRDATWSTPTEPGRLFWVAGLNFVDTVAGAICGTERLGGRPLARGVFTADGTLWALVDNESDPDTLTIGRYNGAQWSYHDLAAKGGSWTSVLAAVGSNVVVLQAGPEPSHQDLIGLSVTTDDGATWSEVADPDVLERDLPFSAYESPDSQIWFSDYTSIAFAGTSALYVADGSGDLWRSTDFTTFSQVEVAGRVSDLKPTGDAVIARFDDGSDLIRISADGNVEAITTR